MSEFITTCLSDICFLDYISCSPDSKVIERIQKIYDEDWSETFSGQISSLTHLEAKSILKSVRSL